MGRRFFSFFLGEELKEGEGGGGAAAEGQVKEVEEGMMAAALALPFRVFHRGGATCLCQWFA